MKKKIILFFVVVLIFMGPLGKLQAATPWRELVVNASSFDNFEVTYAGEVVGEILPRGDFAWVHVHDTEGALSLWVSQALSGQITSRGNYKMTGDLISVVGIFHRACIEHGGAMDIHVSKLEIVRRGSPRIEVLQKKKMLMVSVLLGVLACLLIAYLLKKKLRRK